MNKNFFFLMVALLAGTQGFCADVTSDVEEIELLDSSDDLDDMPSEGEELIIE